MRKRWNELVPRGHAYHISSALDERRMPIPVHGHDFAEIFWVREGRGLHRINGKRIELRAGDLVFMRPSDRHGFSAAKGSRFRLENVAFPCRSLARLRRDYFAGRDEFFWSSSELPASLVLGEERLERFNAELGWLRTAPRDTFSLDCFLLQLFRALGRRKETHEGDLPAWLDRALRDFGSPEDLQIGSSALARLAGRSESHVGRVLRQCCGQTPSCWINGRRLEYAARLLESTHDPVTEVSAACGFENLSYFHRLFRSKYGTSPLRYRARVRAVM